MEGDGKPPASHSACWVFLFIFGSIWNKMWRCMIEWLIYEAEKFRFTLHFLDGFLLAPGDQLPTFSILYGLTGLPAWIPWKCFLPSGFWLGSANRKPRQVAVAEETTQFRVCISPASSCNVIIRCIPWMKEGHVANFTWFPPSTGSSNCLLLVSPGSCCY